MTQGKVISLEIDERKMGDRGSKSAYAVKEQRVDGSSASGKDAVRCTLVAGKPVFGRKENFLHHNHRYGRAFLHSTTITHSLHEHEKKLTTLVKPFQLMKKLDP
jgi:hypothetical protein